MRGVALEGAECEGAALEGARREGVVARRKGVAMQGARREGVVMEGARREGVAAERGEATGPRGGAKARRPQGGEARGRGAPPRGPAPPADAVADVVRVPALPRVLPPPLHHRGEGAARGRPGVPRLRPPRPGRRGPAPQLLLHPRHTGRAGPGRGFGGGVGSPSLTAAPPGCPLRSCGSAWTPTRTSSSPKS